MRHVLGIILAVVLTAAVFFAASWGFVRLHAATATMTTGSLTHDNHALLAIIALAGVALLGGVLLVAPRVSPLATILPGLVFIAWTVFFVLNIHHAVSLVPMRTGDFGRGFKAMLADGALGGAGIVMLIPLFVPSRWRRRADDEADVGTSGLLAGAGFDSNPTVVQ